MANGGQKRHRAGVPSAIVLATAVAVAGCTTTTPPRAAVLEGHHRLTAITLAWDRLSVLGLRPTRHVGWHPQLAPVLTT